MSYTPPPGGAVALLFVETPYTPPAGGAVALVFGEEAGGGDGPILAVITAGFALTGSLSASVIAGEVLARSTSLPWRDALRADAAPTAAPWRAAAAARAATGLPWQPAAPAARATAAPWQGAGQPLRAAAALPWRDAAALSAHLLAAPWRGARGLLVITRTPWGQALRLAAPPVRLPWRAAQALGPRSTALPWRGAQAARRTVALPWRDGLLALRSVALPWRPAGFLEGFGVAPPPPPVTPPGPAGPLVLCFCEPLLPGLLPPRGGAVPLVFGPDPCDLTGLGVVIPFRRTYIVLNTVTATLTPDMVSLDLADLRITQSADAWAWSLSATVPGAQAALLLPTAAGPKGLMVTVNGHSFAFVVEGVDTRQGFADQRASISGRSVTAALAAPYSPPRSRTEGSVKTAQQLALDELPSDTTLDWTLDDWTVDAGVFSYASLSPIDAIVRIAAAAGGIVQSEPATAALRVLPSYPLAPWDWGTADVAATISPAAILGMSTRYVEHPPFEAVNISGETVPVSVLVRRLGTAGAVLAPSVTDPLITASGPAVQRGRSILSTAGRQALVTVELPMLAALGLRQTGELLQIGTGGDAWRGLVRGVTVQASGLDSVVQILELQRHYLD